MRTGREDQTAAAAIRIAAMDLFAEHSYERVTIRDIAAAAGVSPALVIHHYGSKDGLRAVLEERVADFVETMLTDLADAPAQAGSSSVAGLFADTLDREPALAGYVRRLLVDDGPAGEALFGRLLEQTRVGLQALETAGVVRKALDDDVRAVLLLANDLALIILRPHITRVTGSDPLSRAAIAKWSAEAFDIYAKGLFAPPAAAPAQTKSVTGRRRGRAE